MEENSPSSADQSPPAGNPLPVEQLQFRRAEPVDSSASAKRCTLCKTPMFSTYYQAQGQNVCPGCAGLIQQSQQSPAPVSLGKAALYGGGAALAGCALFSIIAMVTGYELALIAIVIGIMVGKAVRHGSGGLGGRPQQILAVALTYFSITTSYIPVFIYHASKSAKMKKVQQPGQPGADTANKEGSAAGNANPAAGNGKMSIPGAILLLLALAAAAPFLALGSGNLMSGLLSILIIFFGLRQAWRLTGRSEILLMGPYKVDEAS